MKGKDGKGGKVKGGGKYGAKGGMSVDYGKGFVQAQTALEKLQDDGHAAGGEGDKKEGRKVQVDKDGNPIPPFTGRTTHEKG